MLSIRAFLFTIAVSLSLAPPLGAQPYPSKPVRIVLGFAAGGLVDTLARALAQRFSAGMGQSFFVENRPGGRHDPSYDFNDAPYLPC